MEGRRKLKFGRDEANDTGLTHDPIWRSKVKVKVTRPLNAVTKKISCTFGKRRPTNFNLGIRMEYNDVPASLTCTMNSEVKGQGYKVTSSVLRMFAHNVRDEEKSQKNGN